MTLLSALAASNAGGSCANQVGTGHICSHQVDNAVVKMHGALVHATTSTVVTPDGVLNGKDFVGKNAKALGGCRVAPVTGSRDACICRSAG